MEGQGAAKRMFTGSLWAAAADKERRSNLERQQRGGNKPSEEEIEQKFWRRRPDRMVINEQKKILYLIEMLKVMEVKK
jgi:hypothetical protein